MTDRPTCNYHLVVSRPCFALAKLGPPRAGEAMIETDIVWLAWCRPPSGGGGPDGDDGLPMEAAA